MVFVFEISKAAQFRTVLEVVIFLTRFNVWLSNYFIVQVRVRFWIALNLVRQPATLFRNELYLQDVETTICSKRSPPDR